MIPPVENSVCVHCQARYAKNEWAADLGLCSTCLKTYVLIDEAVKAFARPAPKPPVVTHTADVHQSAHFRDLLGAM